MDCGNPDLTAAMLLSDLSLPIPSMSNSPSFNLKFMDIELFYELKNYLTYEVIDSDTAR